MNHTFVIRNGLTSLRDTRYPPAFALNAVAS